MEIYPASERPIEGVTGRALYEGMRSRGHKSVRFLPDKDSIPSEICRDLEPGDLVITLGAGDVTQLGPRILEELKNREPREQ
jgi:UDP-N-acetylmuramate--alanine ligase